MLESWQFPRGKSRVSDEERGVTGIEQLSSNVNMMLQGVGAEIH